MKQLAEFLGKINHGAQFALDQAPLVVQERVLYGRITLTTAMVVFGVILLGSLWVALVRWRGREWEDARFLRLLPGIVSGFVCVFVFAPFIQVWFAPRVWIMEWIADLVKGA